MEKQTGKKVLIVDDEQDLREAIATALSYEGFEVITAGDGEKGLAIALKEHPDLIFLDIIMPKLDGVAVLKQIREDAWGSEARIIVMTVLDDMDKIAEVLEEGATEYIVKNSITLGDVVRKAKKHLPST